MNVRKVSGGVDGTGDGTYWLWIDVREVAFDAVEEGFCGRRAARNILYV